MLSDLDRAILDLESRTWRYTGAKERAIRDELAMAPVRYYQRLNALLDTPAAAAHAPIVVGRLRRLRERTRA